MARFTGKIAAITGAGSGIGRCLALQLAAEGASLALSDIDEQGLEETANLARAKQANVHTHIVNVADEDAVFDWADTVKAATGPIDMIFNNAGMSVIDTFDHQPLSDIRKVMDINFWGVVHGCKAFLPHLREKKGGNIINISSLFGLIAVPRQTGYNASKFAVRGFSEALGHEERPNNIDVLCVHPGGIKTNVVRNAGFVSDPNNPGSHDKAIADFEKMARTTPEKAAEIILDAVERKDRRVLVGPDAKFMDKVQRLFPTKYINMMAKLTGKKR